MIITLIIFFYFTEFFFSFFFLTSTWYRKIGWTAFRVLPSYFSCFWFHGKKKIRGEKIKIKKTRKKGRKPAPSPIKLWPPSNRRVNSRVAFIFGVLFFFIRPPPTEDDKRTVCRAFTGFFCCFFFGYWVSVWFYFPRVTSRYRRDRNPNRGIILSSLSSVSAPLISCLLLFVVVVVVVVVVVAVPLPSCSCSSMKV